MIDNKDFLQKQSKVFCIYPWVHLYVSPPGISYPCCISDPTLSVGNTNKNSIGEIVNSPEMKHIRKSMLNETPVPHCEICYKHEKFQPASNRTDGNNLFEKYIDEMVRATAADGELSDFKMRYFDIRFNNLCNFKCRTCGPDFSSQWAAETRFTHPRKSIIMRADAERPGLLEEVLSHVQSLDVLYFAGGEPLITEEHYIMLEEFIKRGKTDVVLRYNTNLSNLYYKDKDLLALWKNFSSIRVAASVDHYGERAEYIRHGTDWGKVESNLKMLKQLPNIKYGLNTVVSMFNYPSLDEFFQYCIDQGLTTPDLDSRHTVYNMAGPVYYAAHMLPESIKQLTRPRIESLVASVKTKGFDASFSDALAGSIDWAESENTWDIQRADFKKHIIEQDAARGENFATTFPELAFMLD
jgi:MoaA/NifB/PqqE/SkfB family radical SAM enzyme